MDFRGDPRPLASPSTRPASSAVDEPREPDPEDKKDKGALPGEPFVLVDPQQLVAFLEVCRDDERCASSSSST